jgi:hypothetical protein
MPAKKVTKITKKAPRPTAAPPRPRGNPNLKNHSPFKKGESFNPGGRPKGSLSAPSFKTILQKIGQMILQDSEYVPRRIKHKFYSTNPITMKTAAMIAAYNAALDGKDWALRYIIDYTEGKPKEFHEIVQRQLTIDIEEGNINTDDTLAIGEEIGTDDQITDIFNAVGGNDPATD